MTMVGTGAVAGPALGGFLVDGFGWRSVFFATIPMVVISVAMCLAVLPNGSGSLGVRSPQRPRFDWLGAFLSSSALLALLWGFRTRTGLGGRHRRYWRPCACSWCCWPDSSGGNCATRAPCWN